MIEHMEEERVVENRQRRREAEEADRVVISPRVIAGKLKDFRAD